MKITPSLNDAVTQSLTRYFDELDGEHPNNLYDLVMQQVEKPMLELVLKETSNNKSKAADILGVNRGTLRKKLAQYDLL
ncbi:MAG: helix-turn-helix domain-containing protein [Pseudomonadota bacterium]